MSVGAGLDVWQTCVLSLLMFTGASQFALVGVIAGGGTPLAGAGPPCCSAPATRSTGCGWHRCSRWRGWRRVGAAHLLIDESTAMGVTRGVDAGGTRWGS